MSELRKIKRALISVSDKTGIVDFAGKLAAFGVQIISTGGTAKTLRENNIEVTEVAEITGFPEMMDGRVKTLHPKIHGAFLALRDNAEHVSAMQAHDIEPIDLVVVNLYPFEQTVAGENVELAEAVENIDIGGPAMIRSAAKNWRDVTVVVDPSMYETIIEQMKKHDGAVLLEMRQMLAIMAFSLTALYDSQIAIYLQNVTDLSKNDPEAVISIIGAGKNFPALEAEVGLSDEKDIYLAKVADLRYGENPHQKAALYETEGGAGIAKAEQLHGKEMSFNNFVDAEAAWNLVQDFDDLAVAIIKHTNPSGVGTGASNEEAYRRALSTDPVSAFGGIVAFNRTVDSAVAASVNEVFTEVVVAPDFDPDALEIFRSKKNLRVLRAASGESPNDLEYKQISGGFLVQEKDSYRISEKDLKIVSQRQPTETELRALLLAWKVCKHVKSNAIVFADENRTIGVGAGQMNRVDSVRIAAMRAERFGLPLLGSIVASDAFFPFRDNVDEAARFGVSAIIQPGGSIKDAESIAAADEHNLVMVLTGVRHFKH
jgi:phosphoribosylaminoimidazolecarboxamide formyltransferase/IMP cyclohydrolase